MGINKRVTLVTGAARGIGLATSKLFLAEGAFVVMVDIDKEELIKATSGLKGVQAIHCDVSDPDAVASMMTKAQSKFDGIDCLVNNAGVADFGPIEQTTFEAWRRVMATNLDGVFLCSQQLLLH